MASIKLPYVRGGETLAEVTWYRVLKSFLGTSKTDAVMVPFAHWGACAREMNTQLHSTIGDPEKDDWSLLSIVLGAGVRHTRDDWQTMVHVIFGHLSYYFQIDA